MSSISQSYSHALALPGIEKSIWGPTWQAFMGMPTDEGGVNPIADQPADYTRARDAESYVYRCSDVRGTNLSQVRLKAFERVAGRKGRAIEHEALGLLEQTNPFGYVDGPNLHYYTLGSLDLHGRSAWALAFNRRKRPSEIYWIIPTQFTPLPDPIKFFRGIRWTKNPGAGVSDAAPTVEEVPPERLCYFTTPNFANPLLGTSKIGLLRNAINLRAYSARSNIDYFKNSMRPDLIVTGEWNNTNENMQRLRREWRQAFSGENNKSPFFAGNNTKATLLTPNAKDMEWLNQQRLSQEEISSTFGVPLVYLNNFDRATYDNISTAKLILYHDTIIPEGRKLARMYTTQLLWRFWPETKQRVDFGFDFDEIEGLDENLAKVWDRVREMSAQITEQVKQRELTPAEARLLRVQLFSHIGIEEDAFKEDIPLGDTFMVQFGNVPIDQASVQAIMNIEAARSSSPLAAELIESIPGAPNAGLNAQRIADTNRQQFEQEHADRRAQIEATTNRSANQAAKGFIAKGPSPLPIRDARLSPIQKKLMARLKKYFQGLKLQAEKKLGLRQKANPIDPGVDPYDYIQAQEDLIEILAEGILLSSQAAYDAAAQDFELDVKWSDENQHLSSYMGKRLTLIRSIDENLRETLRETLLESARDGDSIPVMADKVRDVFQFQIDFNSEKIARTESNQAYASASLAAYAEAGLTRAQMYDGTDYDPTCAAVNGMVVTLAEAQQLMDDEHPNGTRGVSPIVDLQAAAVSQLTLSSVVPPEISALLAPGVRLVA